MDENQAAALSPMLRVADMKKAIKVYTSLGFEKVAEFPGPDGNLFHAILNFRGSHIHISPLTMAGAENSPDYNADYEAAVQRGPIGLGVNFYLQVDDVESAHAAAKKAGLDIKSKVIDQFWGDRTFWAYDPFGYVWTFSQTVKQMSPEEMQAAMQAMS